MSSSNIQIEARGEGKYQVSFEFQVGMPFQTLKENLILAFLETKGGSVYKTSRALQVSHQTLYNIIEKRCPERYNKSFSK